MIRGEKGHLQFTSQRNQEGEKKVKNKRGDEISWEKRGRGVQEKKGSIILQKAELSYPDSQKVRD